MNHAPAQHAENHTKHLLLLGAAGIASSVVLAPYILPLLNIGDAHAAHMAMGFIGGEAAPGFYGTGIAGALQEGIAALPLVGGAITSTASVTIPGIGLTLATGALTTILASAVIGVGGTLLANWLAKREHPEDKVHWSKIIRTVALTTSILISLPSLLTGISVGLTFLANLANTQWGTQMAYAMGSSYGLGATSMAAGSATEAGAVSGLMGMLPHLFTCGGAIFPVVLAMFMGKMHSAPSSTSHLLADTATASPTTAGSVELLSTPFAQPGQPCRLDFQLRDSTGHVLTPAELATMHTKKLHTMIVDSSLTDYHHVHPVYDPARKVFTCSFTPNLQASYAMWNDFTVAGDKQPTQLKTNINLARTRPLPAHILPNSAAQAGDLTFRLSTNGPIRAGQPAMLAVTVTGPDGRPVTDLEPIMGAYAHLAGFSADGAHFIHSHPMGIQPDSDASRGLGQLQFHIQPGQPGMEKFFLQVQRGGRVVTVPFAQLVAPSPGFVSRVENAAPGHAHMAMA